MEKDIYTLKLFEVTYLVEIVPSTNTVSCMRVPGGWIISQHDDQNDHHGNPITAVSSVFVPYNEEFHPNALPKSRNNF